MSFTPAQIAYLDANSDSVEARRIFEVGFASGTVRLIEGSTPWSDGTDTWFAAHGVIQAAGIRASGVMDAHPAQYRFSVSISALSLDEAGAAAARADLSLAHMTDEAEWRDAVTPAAWEGRPMPDWLRQWAREERRAWIFAAAVLSAWGVMHLV